MEEILMIHSLGEEWCTQLFIENSYRHFGHFILGRDKDIECYYIGIRDIYDPKQKDILNIDKVERFKFVKEDNEKIGEVGYWIARVY